MTTRKSRSIRKNRLTPEEREKKEWLKKYGTGWKEWDSGSYEFYLNQKKQIEKIKDFFDTNCPNKEI